MSSSIHPQAEQEVADASDYYTHQAGIDLAIRFLKELERVVGLLNEHPGFGTPVTQTSGFSRCEASRIPLFRKPGHGRGRH